VAPPSAAHRRLRANKLPWLSPRGIFESMPITAYRYSSARTRVGRAFPSPTAARISTKGEPHRDDLSGVFVERQSSVDWNIVAAPIKAKAAALRCSKLKGCITSLRATPTYYIESVSGKRSSRVTSGSTPEFHSIPVRSRCGLSPVVDDHPHFLSSRAWPIESCRKSCRALRVGKWEWTIRVEDDGGDVPSFCGVLGP
jgi:hypothetical protein